MDALVEELEALAFRAWPAEAVVEIAGWQARYTTGVTRRANSVWTADFDASQPLEEALRRAEGFYAGHGQPTIFQVSDATAPCELDAYLQAAGYVVDAPVSVQTGSCSGVVSALDAREHRSPRLSVTVSGVMDDLWFDLSGRRGRFASVQAVYRGILMRLGDRAGYALASVDGAAAGVALGVREAGFVGIFGMLTLPAMRRQGIACALLRALALWGSQGHAQRLYLQVERDNHAALQLYASAGFAHCYGYHYRVRPAAAAAF